MGKIKEFGMDNQQRQESNKIIINSKEIDINSLVIEDVHRNDYPEFCDAFIGEGKDINGNSLNGKELEELENSYPALINQLATEKYWDIGI